MTPFRAALRTCPSSYNPSYSAHSNFLCKVCVETHRGYVLIDVQSYGDARKLSFLRSLKGCLKSRVAFMDFMFMGQCGSLVLERFSAAVIRCPVSAGLNFRGTKLSRMAVEPRKFSTAKIKVHTVFCSQLVVLVVFESTELFLLPIKIEMIHLACTLLERYHYIRTHVVHVGNATAYKSGLNMTETAQPHINTSIWRSLILYVH